MIYLTQAIFVMFVVQKTTIIVSLNRFKKKKEV